MYECRVQGANAVRSARGRTFFTLLLRRRREFLASSLASNLSAKRGAAGAALAPDCGDGGCSAAGGRGAAEEGSVLELFPMAEVVIWF